MSAHRANISDPAVVGSGLHIVAEWRDALALAHLDSVAAWLDSPDVQVWRDVRERQNGILDLNQQRFHVKRLRPHHGRQVDAEVAGLRLLESAGIPTAPLVAWGKGQRGEGVIVTRDLTGFRPADQLISDGDPFSRIAEVTAQIAARLHGARLHHRDLYLCHFMFHPGGEARLIDAARVRRLPWLRRRRWIVKDLAQFRFSGETAGLAAKELDAWLDRWATLMNTTGRSWRRAVVAKAAWIARHDRILARTNPERYRSLRT